jgi:putative DNA primase/helicase
MSVLAHWAARYVERFGFKLTPLRGKAPYRDGWNTDANLIGGTRSAFDHWTRIPSDNIGVCLAPSELVSIDCDDFDSAKMVLGAEGVDLDALIAATPTILGRAPRLEFKAPAVELGRKSVVWPPRADGEKPVTVIEFRAGRVQDVLPPSVHPDLQRPYRWLTPPRNGFPELPHKLLELWLAFDAFRHRARNLCPWASPEPEPEPRRAPRPHAGPSVVAAFNGAHDVVALLEAHGYVRAGRKRWKSPAGHGIAGVVLLPDGRVYCHHASDPLGDEKPHDAFDLYALFEHGGDKRAATRAAAELLRIER